MLIYRRYLFGFAACTAALVTAAVTFNVVVDPYDVFGTPRIEGFNHAKPNALDRARVGKLYQVQRIRPKGLIVGNSRPQMGLATDHACWPPSARPVYNMALPGLSVYKQVRYAQHAMAGGHHDLTVVGVDFLDFLWRERPPADPYRWPPTSANATDEPFAADPEGNPTGRFFWTRLSDYVASTLSIDALMDSITTIARQHRGNATTLDPDGFHPADRLYHPIVRVDGVKVLFQQKNQQVAERLAGEQWHLFSPGRRTSPDFEAIRRLIEQSNANEAKTILFINPYHAEYLLQLDAAGLWEMFEVWKERLSELSHKEDVAIWDFSGFHHYATEPLSSVADRGESLEWFWEPAHYRRELGDIMLENMLRVHCPGEHRSAPEFGTRLDEIHVDGEIETYLGGQRDARDRFKARHPDVWTRIQKLHDRAGKH